MAATDVVTEQQVADLQAAVAAAVVTLQNAQEAFLVLGATDTIPVGTPNNTIIFRTAG